MAKTKDYPCNCKCCLKAHRETEQTKKMWRNAENDNIKLTEKIVEYRKLLEKDSELQAKMADGWCLVSPEDFEKLKTLQAQSWPPR